MRAGTIVASNYLAMAQVLGESFLEHHPDSTFTVLVVDDGDAELPAPIKVIRLEDLDIAPADERLMRTIYDVMEFSTAVKPSLLRYLSAGGGQAACYLDPDIEVFSPFGSQVDEAIEHGIVLTPHVLRPVPRDRLMVDEETIMQSGMYNCGFLAVGPSALPFLVWWHERLRFDAVVDFERSRFTDQRWVDWVPSLFDFTIDRDPGMNVAWWNVHDRPIDMSGGAPTVEGQPVRFVHFSGYDPQQPEVLSKHQGTRPRLGHDLGTGIRALSDGYAARLVELGHIERRRQRYSWNRSTDGVELTRQVRRMVRDAALDELARFGEVRTVPDAFDPAVDFAGWVARVSGEAARTAVDVTTSTVDGPGPEILRETPFDLPAPDESDSSAVAATYDVAFDWADAHGHAVQILIDRPERGVVVDLGCGYAPHAEVLRDAGFEFIGLDLDEASITRLGERGFVARRFDLSEHERLAPALDEAIRASFVGTTEDAAAGSALPVVGVMALDVLEHLVEPHLLLTSLHRWLAPHDAALLVTSVPNVAHRDIAAKLMAGRWDVTVTGLLDHTHVRFFTDRSLTALTASTGFTEAVRNDRIGARSDQRWPAGATITSPHTPLGGLVAAVRDASDPHGDTYQLIRGYRADTEPSNAGLVARDAPSSDASAATVCLTVVADPTADTDDLATLRQCLQTQTSSDWELLSAVTPAVSPEERVAALDALVAVAGGTHIAFVERSETLSPRWVQQFTEAALVTVPGGQPRGDVSGRVLRCEPSQRDSSGDLAVDPAQRPGPDHPVSAVYAFPTEAVRAFAAPFTGDAHEAIGVFLGLAPLCGVEDTGVAVVVPGARSTSATWTLEDDHDVSALAAVLSAVNELPGHVSALEAEIDRLRQANQRLERDNRWLNTELASAPVRVARRILRRPGSAD